MNTDEQPVAGEFSTPLTRADVGKVENPARLDLHLQKQNIAELATQKQFLQTLVENNFSFARRYRSIQLSQSPAP